MAASSLRVLLNLPLEMFHNVKVRSRKSFGTFLGLAAALGLHLRSHCEVSKSEDFDKNPSNEDGDVTVIIALIIVLLHEAILPPLAHVNSQQATTERNLSSLRAKYSFTT